MDVNARIQQLVAEKKPQTLEDGIDIIFQVKKEVLIERHRKYGKDNIRADGVYGIMVRIGDKLSRIRNYYKSILEGKTATRDFNDDSLSDSFLDGGNYFDIALLYDRGLWELPLKENLKLPGERPTARRIRERKG